jgi:signal transduction histidine kinase
MQMLANLVENSTVHCPSGARISLALSNESGTVVTLADNGPGIPPDARDMVLRRFSRLDASRSTSGSGLGLALVKAVADLHGAGLVLSDAGPGLRIEVRFPDEAACR